MKRREFIAGLCGMAAWPFTTRAQQAALPVIGFLSGSFQATGLSIVAAYKQGRDQ